MLWRKSSQFPVQQNTAACNVFAAHFGPLGGPTKSNALQHLRDEFPSPTMPIPQNPTVCNTFTTHSFDEEKRDRDSFSRLLQRSG
jgi:hypothetical protein